MTTNTINEQYYQELPQFSIEEYEAEDSYFNEYDQEMAEAVTEADYYDYEKEEEQQQEDMGDDSLLKLIVDVQSYLSEAPKDSPLLALQYKMYSYLKQRATEMGMDISSLA